MLRAVALTILIAMSVPSRALAQDARAEAREHFSRGLTLYDEGRLVEALAEFEEAYRIAPNARLLYNLGQIHGELGHAVEATDAYERFLREATDVDPALRRDAEEALATQRARVGQLSVEVSVPGARVFVDDVEVGTAPLSGPLAVSAGEHVVAAQAPGHETQRHRFRVAGRATHAVTLTLVPSGSRGASLRIESRVPGVEVRVDGISMGLTPLDATVPVSGGSHRVEGLRDGYEPFALDVTAAEGSETRVVVQTRPEPSGGARASLSLALPSTATTVRIDGETVAATDSVEVPIGLHDVEIRAPEREPVDVRIDVPEDGYELTPAYVWTPDALAARRSDADGQRTLGLGLAIAGGVTLLGGLAMLIGDLLWFDGDVLPRSDLQMLCVSGTTGRFDGTPDCLRRLMQLARPELPPIRMPDALYDALVGEYNDDLTVHYALLGTSIAIASIGAVGVIAGLALFSSAPSESDITRSALASLRVHLGLGSLMVEGSF